MQRRRWMTFFHPRAEGDGRGSEGTARALASPRDTASSCQASVSSEAEHRGVGIEQVGHRDDGKSLQLRQRLQHGGEWHRSTVALYAPHALICILNLIRRKDLTPRHLDGVHPARSDARSYSR